MAHTLTTELSLIKPTPGTHEPYGFVNENANLDTIDALFNSTTGHAHNAAHKGALIAFTGMVNPIASPHMTSPVVDSGGLTITAGGETITAGGLTVTAGGLRVTAGNVGIGLGPVPQNGVSTAGLTTSGAVSQVGFADQHLGNSSATSEITGFWSNPGTAAAAFTCTTVAGFHALNPSVGAGSTITNAYGLLVDGLTAGGTNNYGIYVAAPSGASAANFAIYAPAADSVFGTAGIANGATVGFLQLPYGGGTPTGVPATLIGIPVRFNTADNKLYAYISGGWKASPAFA